MKQNEFEESDKLEDFTGQDSEEEEETFIPKRKIIRPAVEKERVVSRIKKQFEEKPEVLEEKEEEPKPQIQYVAVPRAVSVETMFNEISDKQDRVEQEIALINTKLDRIIEEIENEKGS